MSWRTWIGKGKKPWADYNSEDYGTLEELANAARWHMPARLITESPEEAIKFLDILDMEWSMGPDEFWTIQREDREDREECIEHPSWEEVETYLGIKRPEHVDG